jgi:hypothetical protein
MTTDDRRPTTANDQGFGMEFPAKGSSSVELDLKGRPYGAALE